MKIKKAESTSETIIMMYRLLLLTIIVLTIMGISNMVYTHTINVKDPESFVLSKKIINCIVNSPGFQINDIKENYNSNILKYCNFKYKNETEIYNKYFIRLDLIQEDSNETILYGDDGKSWVNEILKNSPNQNNLDSYKQGYSNINTNLILNQKQTELNLEVYINE